MASQKKKKKSDSSKCNIPETAFFPVQWKRIYQSLLVYCF